MLALRLGYKTGPDNRLTEVTNTLTGLTAGVGLDLKTFQIDVAYVPYGDLGDTYRVSLLTRFGGQETEVREQRAEKRKEKQEK